MVVRKENMYFGLLCKKSISGSNAVFFTNYFWITQYDNCRLESSIVLWYIACTSFYLESFIYDSGSFLGIAPDGIVGHSVGELGCAYADGSFTAKEVILAAYWRGQLL